MLASMHALRGPTSAPFVAGNETADRLRVQLLGRLRLFGPNDEEIVFQRRGTRALFAYLYLAPGAVGREHLATLLWSGRSRPQAQASLRQCLLELRKTLADAGSDLLHVSRHDVAVRHDRFVSDVGNLEAALERDDDDTTVRVLRAAARATVLEDVDAGGGVRRMARPYA